MSEPRVDWRFTLGFGAGVAAALAVRAPDVSPPHALVFGVLVVLVMAGTDLVLSGVKARV